MAGEDHLSNYYTTPAIYASSRALHPSPGQSKQAISNKGKRTPGKCK